MGMTKPGDIPTRFAGRKVKPARVYGIGRRCSCGAELSRYSPDRLCRLCMVRERKGADRVV